MDVSFGRRGKARDFRRQQSVFKRSACGTGVGIAGSGVSSGIVLSGTAGDMAGFRGLVQECECVRANRCAVWSEIVAGAGNPLISACDVSS